MAVCDIADRAVTFDNIYPNFKNFCQRFCSALLHIQKIRNEITEQTKWVNPLEYVINFLSWFISLFTRNEEQNIAKEESWVEEIKNQKGNKESKLL